MKLVFALSFLLSVVASAGLAAAGPMDTAQVNKKAKFKTGIEWKIQPEHTVVILDGKKLGQAGKLRFTKTRAGKHTIHLIKGGDETEMDVQVRKGQVLKFTFSFDE